MMTMKWVPGAMAVLVALSSGAAFAQSADCLGNASYVKLDQTAVQALLGSNTACYPAASPYTNQEYITGGELWDFKKGPGDRVDPASNIGTATIDSSGQVIYNYTGGSSYTYSVWGASTSGTPGFYDFCGTGGALAVRVAPGQAGCGG